jgi:hypothetical protein
MVAFMDGPVVLAGLCNDAPTLYGSKDQPDTMLVPYNERQWGQWVPGGYEAHHQAHSMRFLPLCDISDERYTVYFPVQEHYRI